MVLADFGGSQEELTQMASIGSYAAIAFGVLGLPIGWLFQGLVIWLLAVAFGAEARFSHAFSLAAHLGVVSHLTGWSILAVLMSRGVEAVELPSDLQATPGLNLLLSTENDALSAIYASINPFTLWYMALLALAATTVFQVSQRKGFAIAGIYWGATTALAAVVRGVSAILAPV